MSEGEGLLTGNTQVKYINKIKIYVSVVLYLVHILNWQGENKKKEKEKKHPQKTPKY